GRQCGARGHSPGAGVWAVIAGGGTVRTGDPVTVVCRLSARGSGCASPVRFPPPYRRGAFGEHKKWVLTSATNLGNAFGTAMRGGTIEPHARPRASVALTGGAATSRYSRVAPTPISC